MGGSRGGFAEKFRAMGALAVKIPEEMSSQDAAPLLCAGVTVWSPIHRYVTAGAPLHCQQWRLGCAPCRALHNISTVSSYTMRVKCDVHDRPPP